MRSHPTTYADVRFRSRLEARGGVRPVRLGAITVSSRMPFKLKMAARGPPSRYFWSPNTGGGGGKPARAHGCSIRQRIGPASRWGAAMMGAGAVMIGNGVG